MDLKIRKTEGGQFELVQSIPTVIGSFADQAMARKVMLFLVEDALDQTQDRVQENKPAAFILPPEPPAPKPAPKAKPALKKEPKPSAPVQADSTDWTEAELKDAFAALSAGEKLTDVAAGFGKSWTVLRAKWAAYRKNNATQTTPTTLPAVVDDTHPLTKVSKAVAELSEQPNCKLCNKPFTQTPDQLDLCARCSHV